MIRCPYLWWMAVTLLAMTGRQSRLLAALSWSRWWNFAWKCPFWRSELVSKCCILNYRCQICHDKLLNCVICRWIAACSWGIWQQMLERPKEAKIAWSRAILWISGQTESICSDLQPGTFWIMAKMLFCLGLLPFSCRVRSWSSPSGTATCMPRRYKSPQFGMSMASCSWATTLNSSWIRHIYWENAEKTGAEKKHWKISSLDYP